MLVSTNFAARLVSTHFLASGLVVTNMWRGPFLLGPFSVALLLSNLWITFLLPKSYVGNVGYVGYRFKLARKHTALAMTGSYCHYDNENKTS